MGSARAVSRSVASRQSMIQAQIALIANSPWSWPLGMRQSLVVSIGTTHARHDA